VALNHIAAIWLALSLIALAAAPDIADREMIDNANAGSGYAGRSDLARELTEAWHTRFLSRWPVVAALPEIADPMTFYSPDHPAPLITDEVWSSGLTSLAEAKRLGFIGVCDASDPRLPTCEAWMTANAAGAEQLTITTRRFFHGHPSPSKSWRIYIVPPGK
jgi:hypothetical protein